jgi:hypothetical protein
LEDLVDEASIQMCDVEAGMQAFIDQKMVHIEEGASGSVYVLSNWGKRQFASDNVTARTQKHRANEAKQPVAQAKRGNGKGTFPERSHIVEGNVRGTPPDSDSDSERRESVTSKAAEEQNRSSSPAHSSRSTMVPDKWKVTSASFTWAQSEGWLGTREELQLVANNFVDDRKRKAVWSMDWEAEWRIWVRREIREYGAGVRHGRNGKHSRGGSQSAYPTPSVREPVRVRGERASAQSATKAAREGGEL